MRFLRLGMFDIGHLGRIRDGYSHCLTEHFQPNRVWLYSNIATWTSRSRTYFVNNAERKTLPTLPFYDQSHGGTQLCLARYLSMLLHCCWGPPSQ